MDALLHVALGRGTRRRREGIGSERIDRRLAIGSGGLGPGVGRRWSPTEDGGDPNSKEILIDTVGAGHVSSLQGAGFDEVGRREHLEIRRWEAICVKTLYVYVSNCM